MTGYGLASALAIPLGGWATHRFGATGVRISALAAFTIASIVCASARSIEALIGLRLVQGLASGFSIPLHYPMNFAYAALSAGLLLAIQSVGAYISRSLSNRLVTLRGTRATAHLFITCTIAGPLPFAISTDQNTGRLIVQGIGLFVRGGGIGALTVLTMSGTYRRDCRTDR